MKRGGAGLTSHESGRRDSGSDAWEELARENPFWGVLSHDAFVGASASSIPEEFWRSGELHVARVLDTIRRRFDPSFSPHAVLDFGCGVGRLLRPFAWEAGEVVGVDASSTMRSLALETLRENGVEKGRVVATTGELLEHGCSFDLVHSVLVFQHLRRHVGEQELEQVLAVLAPGGYGALHFYLGRNAPWLRRAVGTVRARSRLINVLVSTLRGAPTTEGLPYEMNAYDLRPLIVRLIDAGISQLWVEAWLDGEGTDAMLFFRRDTHR